MVSTSRGHVGTTEVQKSCKKNVRTQNYFREEASAVIATLCYKVEEDTASWWAEGGKSHLTFIGATMWPQDHLEIKAQLLALQWTGLYHSEQQAKWVLLIICILDLDPYKAQQYFHHGVFLTLLPWLIKNLWASLSLTVWEIKSILTFTCQVELKKEKCESHKQHAVV